MRLNDFDRIAFAYDFLARLVFGKWLIDSQKYFLGKIPDGAKVLILGGGTGWILTELFAVQPNCEAWYVEASEKMINKSRKRMNADHFVNFIKGTEWDIPSSIKFDAVITHFFLDLFHEDSLQRVVEKIQFSQSSNAIWIAADFVKGKEWWKGVMLKMMYRFFQLTCRIESKELSDWKNAVGKGRQIIETKTFCYGFIESNLFA